MYLAIGVDDLVVYEKSGILKVHDRLLVCKNDRELEDWCHFVEFRDDDMYLRDFMMEDGEVVFALCATFDQHIMTFWPQLWSCKGGDDLLRDCVESVVVVQRAYRRNVLRRNLAAMRSLSRFLPLDLVVQCLPLG